MYSLYVDNLQVKQEPFNGSLVYLYNNIET